MHLEIRYYRQYQGEWELLDVQQYKYKIDLFIENHVMSSLYLTEYQISTEPFKGWCISCRVTHF